MPQGISNNSINTMLQSIKDSMVQLQVEVSVMVETLESSLANMSEEMT